MSKSGISNYDRRSSVRSTINGATRFKLSNQDTYSNALIIDISQTGVLIGLNQQLDTSDQFSLIMKSEEEFEGEIKIIGEVIRVDKELGDGCYTYGCKISDVTGF